MRRALAGAFRLAMYAAPLLFLLSIALWIRSYRSADGIHFQRSKQLDRVWRTTHFGVFGARGSIVCYRQTSQSIRAEDAPAPGIRVRLLQAPPVDFLGTLPRGAPSSEAVGLAIARDYFSPGSAAIVVPFWIVLTLLSPLAFLAVRDMRRRIIRRRRRRLGLCPDCGYDLRATPGVCPECGRPSDLAVPPRVTHAPAATMAPQRQEVS